MERGKNVSRAFRKVERSPEEVARERAIRERYQRERPTLDDLIASGECEPPIPLGLHLDLQEALVELRRAREQKGLSLTDVAERSGIDRAALSRLESGRNTNPTVETLGRYAAAIGKRLVWSIDDEADSPRPAPAPLSPSARGRRGSSGPGRRGGARAR